jgi:hypothetical protein
MPSTNGKYAPKAWGAMEFDFDLPSGDVCQLKKIDPFELAEAGLLDQLDFATSVVMNTHAKNGRMSNVERVKRDRARREAQGRNPDEVTEEDVMTLADIAKNAEHSKAFREVLNKLIAIAVVQPEMHLPPPKGKERNDEWFYVDAVPFPDKMAIFNRIMEGVRGVEQFREGPEETVGDVAPKPVVRAAAKRPARAKGPAK